MRHFGNGSFTGIDGSLPGYPEYAGQVNETANSKETPMLVKDLISRVRSIYGDEESPYLISDNVLRDTNYRSCKRNLYIFRHLYTHIDIQSYGSKEKWYTANLSACLIRKAGLGKQPLSLT